MKLMQLKLKWMKVQDSSINMEEGNIESPEDGADFRDHQINLGKALKRLESNEDFLLLFNDGYVINYAITQVTALAGAKPESREKILENMIARSHFIKYIDSVRTDASMAVEQQREIQLEENYERQERELLDSVEK